MTPTRTGDPGIDLGGPGPAGRNARRRRLLWSAAGVGLVAVATGAWVSLRSADGAVAPADDVVAQALRKGKPTVVEFGANACATCRDMKPVLVQLAREHGHRIEVVDVDIIQRREYIAGYRIQLMPTQVFFDARGREIGRHMGRIGPEEILVRLGAADAGAAR
jgi:thioredoxin 1